MSNPKPLHEHYFGHGHVTVIKPSSGWRMLDVRELWAYRELLLQFVMRDVKVRYKQTVLGIAWAVIQPVMTMIVFSLIFGRLARMPTDGHPYPVFVYSALLPWLLFANSVGTSANSLVGSAHLITKIYFPRLIIPLSSAGVGLLDFAFAGLVLVGMMLWYGIALTWQLLALPLLLAAVLFTALGVGTWLSALTAAYRDFRYVVPFVMQIWMFATPVVYPASLVPQQWQWVLWLNPMAGLIEGFRAAFLGTPFNWLGIGVSFAISVAVFVIGIAYFEKLERRVVDIL
jgi:lipopolysaccharide transport system permease protein